MFPFALKALAIISSDDNSLTLAMFIGHGELLLVMTTLNAVAIGELFGVPSNSITMHIVGWCTVLLMALSAGYYAHVSMMSDQLNINTVTNISLTMFLITVITTCSCMLFLEKTGDKHGQF
ncbi:MAG TPA: hypothetical protein EYP59_07050 [Thiotrichaceae bacterium]|nr:hypothetical protein [Thiotrichaceae bacterium]